MKIIVIGAGPAGIMAAGKAAEKGAEVLLAEKNGKIGKKLFITGKGRCNVTNNCTEDEFIKNVATNPRFLHSAVKAFSPQDAITFFECLGVKLKTERGNRVFPFSDRAADVLDGFKRYLKRQKVTVALEQGVQGITPEGGGFTVKCQSQGHYADRVIICTGGASYPATGSDGSFFKVIKSLGHAVVPLKPALCALKVSQGFVSGLAGLSLKNVRVKAHFAGKKVFEDFGEMLFTHEGISGPVILSMSSVVNKLDINNVSVSIDLKPALDEGALLARINRDFDNEGVKSYKNVLANLLPKSLIPVIIELTAIGADRKAAAVSGADRKLIAALLKNFTLNLTGLYPLEGAIVTSGGVCVKEINPSTMESKLVKGIYFAGEAIDTDAFTGGFNIQCALSTGFLAGINAAVN